MKHYWEHPAILMYLCLWRCIAPSFIQVNLGLSVPKGQSAFLSKEDLQFNVPKENDSCKVEVVVNEPITQRVGKLTPQVFDCHFLANEVKYTHNGCPILDEDQVMLRLYRFTETETFTETFILKVHLLDSDCNIIQLGSTSLEVPEFYGFSNIIDRNVLTFVYDAAMNLDCTVHITIQDTLLPAYGQLVMGKPPEGPARGDQPNSFLQIMKTSSKEKSSQDNLKEVHALEVNCEEFLVLGLHYQHLRPPSPDVDYITISLELVDSRSKNVHKKENAWIPVRIRNAFPNLPPKASFIAMYILEVDQFILTPITTHTLDGEDSESPKTQLVFNVTKPPLQGFITHLSDHTKPITSFTWTDLNEMLIAFQPPNNSHTERRNYEVEFEVHDFYFRNSAPIMVHISIRTTDTNAPRVSWNMGLDLLEGQSRTITWEQFQVVDNDALSAVRLITVDGLLHGRLTVRGGKGFMFTVDDIKSGVVHYHHDDSDSTNDFIVFRIFDGNHSTRHKFPINILPKDDSPPFLINNVILELYEDQEIQIEKVMLQASDMDSSDDYILFKIIKPPQAGEILKRTAPELSGYPITRFQQSDLFNARIYYRHLGGEVFEDTFEFILSDSHEPPNLSDPQTVIIHITPVDDQLPKEAPWALRHLVVKETEIAHLTKNQLYFTDTEIPDGEIVYAITAGPFFTSALGLSDAGKLFLTDSMKKLTKKSNVPMLRSFTQHAVNYLKVAYMPPIQDIGPDPQHVQFLFSVSNQHGGTLIGLCFNITVLPVDNQAPEILTKQLDVEEGGVGQITVDHILVMDVDTKDHQIKIVLQKQPVHGVVKVDGDPMIEGDIFNLEDLGQLKISYNHDDSETRHDEVTFSATDGSNSAECVLQIQILPVNDEPPTMKPGLKPMMYCLEGAEVAITAENLYATDLDSDDERLMFMIARQPFHGAVQKDSQIIDHFSQADILSGSVTYIHTGGEVGLTPCFDTITFVISDWDGGTVEGCCSEEPFSPLLSIHNSLPVYDLNITIMPINNQPPTIIIGETFIVDEGLSAAITVGHLCASDLDTANDELTFILWSSPQFGYIENTLPSPGYEKSNVGISIDSFDMKHIKDFQINYVQFHHQQIEPTADQFMLYVTDGQHQSAAVPFYIIIQPTNDEPPSFLARNITVSEGQVRELDPSIINVADLDLPTDSLVFIIKQQPNHGKIVNGNDIIQYKHQIHSHEEHLVHDFTMDQLKHGMKLMYKHDDSETKTDSFTIQLSDGKHTVQKVIQVTILPVNDEKPLLSRNNELEVEFGDSRIISSVVLEAEDKDTSRQHVYYVMDSVPKQGVLQIKEGRDWIPLHPGMNCSQDDIDMNRLRYIHTGAIGSNGRDSFHFHLSDGDHRSSVHRFQIFIQNIEKGEIMIFLKPLTIFMGERGILTTAVLLASDGSNKPEELLYVITMPPSYGQVEYITYPGVAITSFSQMDVAAQAVSYTHKSTVAATSDSLRFIVSNGLSTRNGSLEIIIENIDRILPTLLNNKGIRLVEGSMVSISPDVLQLSDPDTPPQNLTYIIAQQPQHGQLHLKGAVLKQHNFTQLDVDSMDIAYKHDGGESQIDRFTFVVTDMTNHGFLVNGVLHTEPSVFTIQVDHKDKAFPRIVYLQCPSQVEVFKNQKYGIYISSRHLKASDRDSKDEELIYHILREPNIGYLENVTTGGFIWNKFTQKDLNSRNIIYIISASSAVMSDSLEFQVSDSSGNSALPQILDLKWSRIEMMESEYRVCEDVGLFSVKVLRTGYFMDSAFVGIKVNSISALVGKDFTHSSANLIQFDPGVSVKCWNIVITNDKLEENEESFEVLLTSPINAVLGAKAKILIKIIDGEKDRCTLAFMNDRNEENPPGRVLRERLASGSSTIPNLKSNSSLVEGMAMTNLHEDLKKSQGDVMQQFPLKPPSKKKLMYHGVIALKVEGDHSPSVYNRRATVVITSQSQQHFLGKTELSQTDKVTTVPASQQIPVQQEPSSKICPSGWTYHDDRCYYLNTKHKATWIGAARACKEMYHGNLVSVISKQDMEWLWDFSGRRSFWIGLNDRISPGKWNWAGGEHVSFTNWKRGLPPTSRKKGKNCVLVRRRGKWEVKNCKQGKPHYYMCSVR